MEAVSQRSRCGYCRGRAYCSHRRSRLGSGEWGVWLRRACFQERTEVWVGAMTMWVLAGHMTTRLPSWGSHLVGSHLYRR